MPYESSNGERLVLVDSSCFSPVGEDLARIMYKGPSALTKVNPYQVRGSIGRMRGIQSIPDIRTLPEVIKEAREGLRIFNEQINYARETIKGKGAVNKKRRRRKIKERGVDIQSEPAIIEDLRIMADDLYKTIRIVSRDDDPRQEFGPQQKTLYDRLYGIARKNDERRPSDADHALIATALTSSFERPSIIVTQDLGIKNLFHEMRDAMRKVLERRNRQNGRKVKLFSAHALPAWDFLYLEENGLELV